MQIDLLPRVLLPECKTLVGGLLAEIYSAEQATAPSTAAVASSRAKSQPHAAVGSEAWTACWQLHEIGMLLYSVNLMQ